MAQGRALNIEKLARQGAQRLISRALILEMVRYFEEHENERDEKGNHLVHRNGTAREREILTGHMHLQKSLQLKRKRCKLKRG